MLSYICIGWIWGLVCSCRLKELSILAETGGVIPEANLAVSNPIVSMVGIQGVGRLGGVGVARVPGGG